MPNAVSDVDRDRLISCHERNEDYVSLASSMGINRRTAYGIIDTFLRTGRRHQLRRGGSARLIFTDGMREALIEYVEEKPTATLNEMKQKLLDLFPHSPVSISTISRQLDGSLITLKLLRTVPFSWNTPELKDERHSFAQWMITSGIHTKLIYVDECGYNLWTSRTQGRSLQGSRAVRTVCGQRGQNLTLCLAVSPAFGLVHQMLVTGGMTKEKFAEFLGELSQLLYEEGSLTIIYDNAPPHRDPPALQHELHDQRPLPRYSPFLNITENAISALKSAVKRKLTEPALQLMLNNRTAAYEQGQNLHQHRLGILSSFIQSELSVLTQHKCQRWYEHSTAYLVRCIEKEDIFS